MAADKYAIRRAIVRALARFVCPQDLPTVLCDDRLMSLDADNVRVQKEWNELTAAGYLTVVELYPAYRSLSPFLRKKIEGGESLLNDPLLAGPGALQNEN